MMFSDAYLMITESGEFTYKVKGSKFIAYAYQVKSETEIKDKLQALKQKHPDATHHCYAWVLGADKQNFRANDDGEPSNTAGKPILRQITKLDVCNVLVVVVRYFGGSLLGVPGLIQAYSESAASCLNLCPIQEFRILEIYNLTCPFGMENELYKINKQFQAEIRVKPEPTCFSAEIKIPLYQVAAFKQQISRLYQVNLEYSGVE